MENELINSSGVPKWYCFGMDFLAPSRKFDNIESKFSGLRASLDIFIGRFEGLALSCWISDGVGSGFPL